MLVLLAAGAAFGPSACGGDDHGSSNGSQAPRTQPSAPADERAGGSRSGAGGSGGAQPDDSGTSSSGGTPPAGGSGGARAPRPQTAVRKRSLERYLATNFRVSPWYPMLRRLRISGGHVRVYLDFPPESDDEAPPALACSQVLSYGRQVKRVTVYGAPTPQGKILVMRDC